MVMQSTQFRIRNEGQGRKGRDCPDRLLAFADEVTERRLLQCISPFMAVRPEGANHQWRKNPPGELSIDPVADEQLMRGASGPARLLLCMLVSPYRLRGTKCSKERKSDSLLGLSEHQIASRAYSRTVRPVPESIGAKSLSVSYHALCSSLNGLSPRLQRNCRRPYGGLET
jgi:hypothetical protein